jgi:23S rRNA (cytidine1920-2'-O)/16S rRNA (cytidine1409-2'-O)-methyltransferase
VAVPKQRADRLVVAQGLAPSRERARALILAGRVIGDDDQRIDKAGELLPSTTLLRLRGGLDHPYVSRGGVKLAGALDDFRVDPTGRIAADFGASTGGFTDCLLQRGAARVHAIDVGYGQLHPTLRSDPRVRVRERTNARYLAADSLGEPVDLVVIDASFIGLSKLLPAAYEVLADEGEVIALVKPQFEVGRERVGRGGVVRDPAARADAIAQAEDAAVGVGFAALGARDCRLPGPKGNREAFLHLRRG